MILLYLILLFIHIHLFLSTIIIPFNTISDNITAAEPSTFMYFFFPNKIEVLIKIGTPSQEIALRIKTLRSPISINSVQMGNINIIRFNESNSSSFISISDKPQYFGENDFALALEAKEIITLNNNNNDLILNNLKFLLGIKDNQYYKEGGVLGLNIAEFDLRIKEVGFIKQLKERNFIKNYNFFIDYNQDNVNGNLIIDGLPHSIYPEKFDKNRYVEFYAEIISNSLGLKANEAYFGNVLIDCEFQMQLAVEQNFIRGSPAFKTVLMENFFKEKINRKICEKSIFGYLDSENKEFIYCSKELNLSEFNNISFTIANSDLKIELTYKDLFYEYKDKYYFMIYFPSQTYSYYFILGKLLFQKYTLTFNHETKQIGYYKSNNDNDEETGKDEKQNKNNKKEFNLKDYYYLIPWIFVGILIIIIIILGLYIGYYKPCRNRAKRANELNDDNYSYEEKFNNNINNNE